MPRYKEYNETRVLDKAMYQFWSDGFGASSLSTLTKAMRINKFTFYEAFDNKDSLLIQTMQHYLNHYYLPELKQLQTDYSVIGLLNRILETGQNKLPGCYILTITAETGETNGQAVEILKIYIAHIEKALDEVVRYYHPESAEKENITRRLQLLTLFTSVPLLRSIHSRDDCIEYTRNVLALMNMNRLAGYA